MSKTLVFFPKEKPMINLIRYTKLNFADSSKQVIFLSSFLNSKQVIDKGAHFYSSNWTSEEETFFFDLLYLFALKSRHNWALRHLVRPRFLGRDALSWRTLRTILRHCVAKRKVLRMAFLLIRYLEKPHECLRVLRQKGVIKANDATFFCEFLKSERVDSVVIASTLKDSQSYDLVDAANTLGIRVSILVDSWDNIGTSPCIPDFSGNLYLWSEQQLEEVKLYYPHATARSLILGTPRRAVAESVKRDREQLHKEIKQENGIMLVKILFIQAYFFDDTSLTFKFLEKVLLDLSKKFNIRFLITVREYPFKAPSQNFRENLAGYFEDRDNSDQNCRYIRSGNGELRDDLLAANFVISEISTGGLESYLADVPTLFIYSNHKRLYMNGAKVLNFKFASDLMDVIPAIERGHLESLEREILKFLQLLGVHGWRPQVKEFTAKRYREYFAADYRIEEFFSLFG